MAQITIDETICKGCGMCVAACPKNLLELAKDHINAMCPDVAIKVERQILTGRGSGDKRVLQ